MTLPPWRSNKIEDRRALTRFIIEQLDRADAAVASEAGGDEQTVHFLSSFLDLKQRAQALGLGLSVPKPAEKRGPKTLIPGDDGFTDSDHAALDVPRIRALFRLHWGKRNRTERPMAEEIAAERWGLSEADTAELINEFRKKA